MRTKIFPSSVYNSLYTTRTDMDQVKYNNRLPESPVGAVAEITEFESFAQGVEGITRKKDSTFRMLWSLLMTGKESDRDMRAFAPLDCS